MRYLPIARVLAGTDLLLLLGEWEHAATAIGGLELIAPRSSSYHLLRGTLVQALGQRGPALTALRFAVNRDPLELAGWQRLADLLPSGPEQQIAAERAALLQDPAVVDLRRGKPYLALGRLTHLQEVHPDWPEWTLLRAETLRRLDAADRARDLVKPLLDAVPPPTPALWLMLALDDGEMEPARRELLRTAIADDPGAVCARHCFAPEALPFDLPGAPLVPLGDDVAERIEQIEALVSNDDIKPHDLLPIRARVAKGPAADRPAEPRVPSEPELVLREVQQATRRLLGSTSAPLGDGGALALLVTRRAGLAAHAPQSVDQLLRLIEEYRDALRGRGVDAHVVIVDDAENLAALGHGTRARDGSAEAITEVIQGLASRLTARGRRLDAIVLVGGETILPFHRVPNPTTDIDRLVLSDNPYGSHITATLIPDVVVARLPDGGNDAGALLQTLLQRSIDYHHGWLSIPTAGAFFPLFRRRRGALPAGSPINSWAASAMAWQLPSQTVYNTLKSSEPLVLCPPQIPHTATGQWSQHRVLYFNLHGLSGGPNWYGQQPDEPPDHPLPVALTPDGVGEISPNTICITEACYGAEIAGRTPANSIALRMLQGNAIAFVGSTATSYGAVGLPLGGADVLVEHLLSNLRRGHPVGRALLLARDGLARGAAAQEGFIDPDEAKTLVSFVLYGDPWATPYARPVMESKAPLPLLTPHLVRRQPVPLSLLPTQSILAARHLISKWVPYLREAPIVADGQSRPNRVTKGNTALDGTTVVFSAQANFTTSDGLNGSHVARLTLANDVPSKLLVSH
ncbi:MAG: hypothetical protein NVS4B8_11870 [Herpetosiphon sp.]